MIKLHIKDNVVIDMIDNLSLGPIMAILGFFFNFNFGLDSPKFFKSN
jgi:hypothetical protein